MNKDELLNVLRTHDVVADRLAESLPDLFDAIAAQWLWTRVCAKTLDGAFIADFSGVPERAQVLTILRQIAHEHAAYRQSLVKTAPKEELRLISEEHAAGLESAQAPLSPSLNAILKEAHSLISKDNLSVLGMLRSNGVSFNQLDRDGLSLLAVAAQSGADKCLFALCKNGANPHLCDSLGNSPLHWACAMNQPKAMSVLLYFGANPNSASYNAVSPLMLTVAKSNVAGAEKLLQSGANLMMKDRRGNTVLHRCVQSKNVEMAKFFVACGSFIDDKNSDGQTPWGLSLRLQEFAGVFNGEKPFVGR
jgi:hypothetical protein